MIGKILHVIRISLQHVERETAFFIQHTEMRRMLALGRGFFVQNHPVNPGPELARKVELTV